MVQPIVAVSDLCVYRGQQLVLDQISFTVAPGTDTAIIGPNGAGKSSLIQALLGILPCQQGQTEILGQVVSRSGYLSPELRQYVAYLPQSLVFNAALPMTVAEFVGLGWGKLQPQLPWHGRRERWQAVTVALERVKALHLKSRSLADLSGGETKRVLLAYCLVWPRKLLVLDEAPAGLDAHGNDEFYELLTELKQSLGWTIIQVSHDLDMVSRHCDRVICLNRQLICEGAPSQTLTGPHLQRAYGKTFTRYFHHH